MSSLLHSREKKFTYKKPDIEDAILFVLSRSTHFKNDKYLDDDDIRHIVEQCDKYVKHFADHEETITYGDFIRHIIAYLSKNIIVKPQYQYLAGGLDMMLLRREVFPNGMPEFSRHVQDMVQKGLYNEKLLEHYTLDELKLLDRVIDHDRDFNFHYAASNTFRKKYIMQYRSPQVYLETPQLAYLALACVGFINYKPSERIKYISSFYDAISSQKISLATPILANVRGRYFSTSSCVCLDTDDSIESMAMTGSLAMLFTSQRSGLGINIGRIRGQGTPIKKGLVAHSGILPFLHYFHRAVKSCSQTGIRNGSATLFCPIFHLDAETYWNLKNTQGSHENRIPHLDYCVQINGYFYKKLINNEDLYLIDHSQVPGLYESFFSDQDKFISLYEQAIKNPTISKIKHSARAVFRGITDNRMQTGRVYIQNVDHTNNHSSFKDTIYMSNLCMEITLPTTPPKSFIAEKNDDEYEVAICTLSAINVGNIDDLSEMKPLCNLIVRFLDEMLSNQPYPTDNVAKTASKRRSLGIGVTNLARYLARKGKKFNDLEGRNALHALFEALQFHCTSASCQLAKEYGACDYFNRTKYSQNLLPIDHYAKNIDKYHNQPLLENWEDLRSKIKQYGLRHSTLTCQMPCESTAQLNNCSPGIYPSMSAIGHKVDKTGSITFTLHDKDELPYQYLWDISTKDILLVSGIAQKFFDQSISTNTHYNVNNYPNYLVPAKDLLRDILFAYQIGIKTLYYHHTKEAKPKNECTSCSL